MSTKTERKGAVKAKAPDTELSALIDELGALEEELAPYRPKISRVEQLRRVVAARVTAAPADSEKLDGTKYTALVGPCGMKRFITNMAKLFKVLGRTTFLAHCKFGLEDAEKLVEDPVQLAELIGCDQSGPRSVKTYRLTEGQKAA